MRDRSVLHFDASLGEKPGLRAHGAFTATGVPGEPPRRGPLRPPEPPTLPPRPFEDPDGPKAPQPESPPVPEGDPAYEPRREPPPAPLPVVDPPLEPFAPPPRA